MYKFKIMVTRINGGRRKLFLLVMWECVMKWSSPYKLTGKLISGAVVNLVLGGLMVQEIDTDLVAHTF